MNKYLYFFGWNFILHMINRLYRLYNPRSYLNMVCKHDSLQQYHHSNIHYHSLPNTRCLAEIYLKQHSKIKFKIKIYKFFIIIIITHFVHESDKPKHSEQLPVHYIHLFGVTKLSKVKPASQEGTHLFSWKILGDKHSWQFVGEFAHKVH